jgi:hypothetical protein
MSDYTSFLFARPSVAESIARLVDFGDFLTEFNRSLSEEQADTIALRMDWKAVGNDLRYALSVVEHERQESDKAIQLSFLSDIS